MAENSDECLDDGGDANEIRPWKCGAANVNQKWVYHTENAYIRNPNKQMCLDDNNGDPNKFHLWPCNSQNVNQKFHPVVLPFSKQVLETDPKRMIPNVQLPADKSTKFMIQNASKGLCLDTSTNKPEACDWGGNQMFTYNSNSNQIVAGNGECLDDGGSVNKIHTWPCDANNRNQLWTFDSLTKVFRSLSKNACLDDNDGGQFHLWSCDGTNPNQQYEPSILY
ncbi:ricin B lectin domain-containing protein [Chytriomyces cf. hyalinus JEL632]|nr:ricin B lectin domain-containing protein [Chytriomyces cf. hyalinus JEL632]